MPRIETQTLAEHRDWRRNQLIEAAASIALESGGSSVTVAPLHSVRDYLEHRSMNTLEAAQI
jgi:hypothetical protein